MRVIFSSDSYDKPRKNLYSTLRLGIDILMIILYRLSRYTNIVRVAKAAAHILGEVSERFMELVLKTSDPQGPGVRIPLSPPISPTNCIFFIDVTTRRSTQVGDEAPLLRA